MAECSFRRAYKNYLVVDEDFVCQSHSELEVLGTIRSTGLGSWGSKASGFMQHMEQGNPSGESCLLVSKCFFCFLLVSFFIRLASGA